MPQESAVLSAEKQAEPQAPTAEQIVEMARNRDTTALNALDPESQGAAPKPPEGTPPAAAASSEGQPPAPSAAPAQAPKKVFEVQYGQEKFAMSDDDGFLGHKDVEGLKRKAAHEERHIKQLVTDNASARLAADEAIRKSREAAEEAARLRKELENERASRAVAAAQQPAPVAAQAAAAQASQAVAAKVELPNRPQRPKNAWSPDTNTPEDVKEWNDYFEGMDSYNAKLAEAIRSQPAPANVDPKIFEAEIEKRVQERTKPLSERLEKIESSQAASQADIDREKAEIAAEKMWNGFGHFQENHKAFATQKPLKELHEEVTAWSDQVATACGYSLPYGASPQQRQQYVDTRQRLVQSYLDKDPTVVARVQGIDPPAGHEQYYEVASINQIAQQHNVSLNEALAIHLTRKGTIDGGMESLRVASEQAGRESVARALADSGNLAKPIPNDIAQRQVAPTELPAEKQAELASSLDPRNLIHDQDKLREAKELGAKLGW